MLSMNVISGSKERFEGVRQFDSVSGDQAMWGRLKSPVRSTWSLSVTALKI